MKILDEIKYVINEILNLLQDKNIEIVYSKNNLDFFINIKFDIKFIPHSLAIDNI